MYGMEETLLRLLPDTLSADASTRRSAEAHLLQITTVDTFPTSIATIAAHPGTPAHIRQAALLLLKTFVQSNWAGLEEATYSPIPISEENKELLKTKLLEIAIGNGEQDDRKVKAAARYSAPYTRLATLEANCGIATSLARLQVSTFLNDGRIYYPLYFMLSRLQMIANCMEVLKFSKISWKTA